jgi:sarcosine oxidase subunit alpha
MVRLDRPRLVGLVPVEPGALFRAGSVLLPEGERTGHGLGHVSSIADSPTLNARIGLGFVSGGLEAWQGKTVCAASPVDDQYVRLRVVSPHFFDPEGERMHG